MKPRLAIGNLNYSSWSLRGWLVLKWAGIDFDEVLIDLNQPGYGSGAIAEVLALTPSGKVPALVVDGETIWDTLGIAMWALENGNRASLVPEDAKRRARMWSAIGEMHAGFAHVRRDLSMNIRRRCLAHGLPTETRADIARIDQLWSDCRAHYGNGGPHLFGAESLADAFYLPVATRFRTYGIALSSLAQDYMNAVLADSAFCEWEARVKALPVTRFGNPLIDDLFPDQPESFVA
jgi:glutathione S-transferase